MPRTVSSVILEALAAHGVRHIFGIPGDAINGLADAIRRQETIEFITVRHEEAGAFAASAQAKLTGNLAAVAGTAGPGAIHLLNGLYDAKMDYAPVIAITGQVETAKLGQNTHQEVDLERLFGDVAVFNETIVNPDQTPHLIEAAIRAALTDRGVAHLSIPADLALATTKVESREPETQLGDSTLTPAADMLSAAANALNEAENPTILMGIGAFDAASETIELAERIGAPIIRSLKAKELISDSHPNSVGGLGLLGTEPAVEAIDRCDVLLMVGTDFPYEEFLPKRARVIQVDIEASRIGQRADVEIPLVGDAGATLRALLPLVETAEPGAHLIEAQSAMSDWNAWRSESEMDDSVPIRPQRLAAEVIKHTPPGTVFTCDTGAVTVWAARHLDLRSDDRFTLSGSLASMAFALPAAIGAQLAYPERKVVALTGDGGFGMLIGDLMTAVSLELPITVVVFNNSKLGLIQMEQEAEGLPEFSTGLSNPNFAEVARAMGAEGWRVESPEQLAPAMAAGIASDKPTVIDVVIEANEPTLPPKISARYALNFARAKARELFADEGGLRETIDSTVHAISQTIKKA